MVVKHLGQGARLPGFRSQRCYSPVVVFSKLFKLSVQWGQECPSHSIVVANK